MAHTQSVQHPPLSSVNRLKVEAVAALWHRYLKRVLLQSHFALSPFLPPMRICLQKCFIWLGLRQGPGWSLTQRSPCLCLRAFKIWHDTCLMEGLRNGDMLDTMAASAFQLLAIMEFCWRPCWLLNKQKHELNSTEGPYAVRLRERRQHTCLAVCGCELIKNPGQCGCVLDYSTWLLSNTGENGFFLPALYAGCSPSWGREVPWAELWSLVCPYTTFHKHRKCN